MGAPPNGGHAVRAKDETGRLLPPPHKRLPEAAIAERAAVFAISRDARCAHLPLLRKLALVRKAIDHVVDGDAAPAWVFAKDRADPDNHMLSELWRVAVREVTAALPKAVRP